MERITTYNLWQQAFLKLKSHFFKVNTLILLMFVIPNGVIFHFLKLEIGSYYQIISASLTSPHSMPISKVLILANDHISSLLGLFLFEVILVGFFIATASMFGPNKKLPTLLKQTIKKTIPNVILLIMIGFSALLSFVIFPPLIFLLLPALMSPILITKRKIGVIQSFRRSLFLKYVISQQARMQIFLFQASTFSLVYIFLTGSMLALNFLNESILSTYFTQTSQFIMVLIDYLIGLAIFYYVYSLKEIFKVSQVKMKSYPNVS